MKISLNIQQLQRLDDSPLSRQACLQLVQDTYPLFYMHNLQLRARCETLAASLGGKLHAPLESVGFAAMRRTVGRPAAETMRHWVNRSRVAGLRWRERVVSRLMQHSPQTD